MKDVMLLHETAKMSKGGKRKQVTQAQRLTSSDPNPL